MGGRTNFEDFANAIILQAVKDYRAALKTIKKNPRSRKASAVRDEVERFFRSEWFSALTGIDGPALMAKLKEEIS